MNIYIFEATWPEKYQYAQLGILVLLCTFLKVFSQEKELRIPVFIHAFFKKNSLSSYIVVFLLLIFIPEFLLLMTNFNTTVFSFY